MGLNMARVAEQFERYEDMAEFLNDIIEECSDGFRWMPRVY